MVAMNLMTVLGSLCALGLLALPGALGVQDPEDFVNLLAGSFTDGRSYSSELLIMLQLLLYRDSRSSLLCLCMCVCDCSRKHPAADRTTLGCVAHTMCCVTNAVDDILYCCRCVLCRVQPLGTADYPAELAVVVLVVQRKSSHAQLDALHTPAFTVDRRLGLVLVHAHTRIFH